MSVFGQFSDFSSLLSFFNQPSQHNISVFHVNIRSLRKYWNEFQVLVSCVEHVVDVFVLTEISVQSDMLDRFTLPGYQSSFSLRDHRLGGGIAVYVKDTWCTNPFSVSFSSAECLGLEIVSDVSRISILAVYRPPSQNVLVFLDELKSTLTDLNLVDNFILVGDFNIDTMKPSRSSVCDYLTLEDNETKCDDIAIQRTAMSYLSLSGGA